MVVTQEERRLVEARRRVAHWKRWGPYLTERQWGTVREDYSADGDAWDYFPHDHARSPRLPLERGRPRRHLRPPPAASASPWRSGTERDPILKERLFGLTRRRGQPRRGRQGVLLLPRRHADPLLHASCSTSTRRPSSRTPGWSRRTAAAARHDPEFELLDTGVFDDEPLLRRLRRVRQGGPEDILIRITVDNRGPDAAPLHLLPHALVPQHLGVGSRLDAPRSEPRTRPAPQRGRARPRRAYGELLARLSRTTPELLFTENETNAGASSGSPNRTPLRQGRLPRLRRPRRAGRGEPGPDGHQGRGALSLRRSPAGEPRALRLRSRPRAASRTRSARLRRRLSTSAARRPTSSTRRCIPADALRRRAARHAAGLRRAALVASSSTTTTSRDWLDGRSRRSRRRRPSALHGPQSRLDPPLQRRRHLHARQVGVPLVRRLGPGLPLRPARAGRSRLRQGAAHPAAARVVHAPERPAAAYEWAFGDVNPPVHAWAAWRVYKIDRKQPRPAATARSWSASSTSCCSTSPGG